MSGQNPFDDFTPRNPIPPSTPENLGGGGGGEQYDGPRQDLPNATAGLVLGILSIVFALCYGIPGIVLGIIGMVLSNQAIALNDANPGKYNPQGVKNANAGKICSIIGLALGILVLIIVIFAVIIAMNEPRYYYRRRGLFD